MRCAQANVTAKMHYNSNLIKFTSELLRPETLLFGAELDRGETSSLPAICQVSGYHSERQTLHKHGEAS